MTSRPTAPSLMDLQNLDVEIVETEKYLAGFGPRLAQVDEPAAVLMKEAESTEARIREMQLEERRLELAADERRDRIQKLETRFDAVRNLREEAAVHAELDLVRRALEGDEMEALTLLDQIRRLEGRLEETRSALGLAEETTEPTRRELLRERDTVEERFSRLRERREDYARRITSAERRVYESVRAGGRGIAVSALTDDGACGHCFGMLPLQRQNGIRHGLEMIRCEFCGVILTAPSPGEPEAADGIEVGTDDDVATVLPDRTIGEEGESG